MKNSDYLILVIVGILLVLIYTNKDVSSPSPVDVSPVPVIVQPEFPVNVPQDPKFPCCGIILPLSEAFDENLKSIGKTQNVYAECKIYEPNQTSYHGKYFFIKIVDSRYNSTCFYMRIDRVIY